MARNGSPTLWILTAAVVLSLAGLLGWRWSGHAWPMGATLVLLIALVALAEQRANAARRTAEHHQRAERLASEAVAELERVERVMIRGLDLDEVEPLGQDDYVALLAADAKRAGLFTDHHCSRCGGGAVRLSITHPIWEGPHHGMGSGRVDTRTVELCPTCDVASVDAVARTLGLWPVPPGDVSANLVRVLAESAGHGRPIRLPHIPALGVIALRDELMQRPAFHRLMVAVEPAAPRPAPPPGHLYVPDRMDPTKCFVCGYPVLNFRHDPTRPHQVTPTDEGTVPDHCRFCDKPAADPVHLPTGPPPPAIPTPLRGPIPRHAWVAGGERWSHVVAGESSTCYTCGLPQDDPVHDIGGQQAIGGEPAPEGRA